MLDSQATIDRALPKVRVWPFFSTPPRVFAAVIGPIAGMMLLLTVFPGVPTGIRMTAGLVVAVSLISAYRGYAHRIELRPDGVRYRSPGRTWFLPWHEIRRIGRYVPLDRNQATQYVYITRLDNAPVDWREIDAHTIQLQDRPGLLESVRECWLRSGHGRES